MEKKQVSKNAGGGWNTLTNFVNNLGFSRNESNVTKKNNKATLKMDLNGTKEFIPIHQESVVAAVVLSVWDHICGPRDEKIWKQENRVPNSVIEMNAPFTLQGQMGNMLDPDEDPSKQKMLLEHKFLVLSNFFACSVVFSAPLNGQQSAFSLSLIFHKDVLHKYMFVHNFIKERLLQLVLAYKEGAEKNDPKALEEKLIPEIEKMDKLFSPQITFPPITSLNNTLWGKKTLEPHLKNFLTQVITSHLQTGSTVIVGPDATTVTEWVNTLSLFLLPHQRHISRSSVTENLSSYVPDLALQGIVCVLSQTEETELKNHILQCSVPSTLVVLQGLENEPSSSPGGNVSGNISYYVKQTHPYNEYTVVKRDSPQGKNRENMDDVLRTFDQSPLILDVVDKIYRLPESPHYLRLGFIHQNMNLLQRKAIVLIKYVEAIKKETEASNSENEFTDNPDEPKEMEKSTRIPKDDNNEVPKSPREGTQVTGGISDRQKRRIRSDIGLQDSCFYVLLGIAEKLKPGIYVAAAGNPLWFEERLIELFERF